jgi:hypothetical protein
VCFVRQACNGTAGVKQNIRNNEQIIITFGNYPGSFRRCRSISAFGKVRHLRRPALSPVGAWQSMGDDQAAMPGPLLDSLQPVLQRQRVDGIVVRQALGVPLEPGHPHGDVESVEDRYGAG